jgi:GNAT superfamily N-acetyltransferase
VIEPEVAVRPAAHDDAGPIARLLASGSREPQVESPDDPARYVTAIDRIREAHGDVLVAVYDGAVVGVLQVMLLQHLQHAGGKVAEVESVHVDEGHRRHGVGATLLEAAVGWAADQGCYRVQLTSHETRDGAHEFYASCGFVPTHVGFKLTLDDDASESATAPTR